MIKHDVTKTIKLSKLLELLILLLILIGDELVNDDLKLCIIYQQRLFQIMYYLSYSNVCGGDILIN